MVEARRYPLRSLARQGIANSILADVAGKHIADAHRREGQDQQKIICDFLSGENGREKSDNWLPRRRIPGRKPHETLRLPHRR
ncbi:MULTISPECIES: hypothetical protein [Mesorhizobium]|uniref:hypothetical protein n=1 Tax=Mesorhizobium TaxID=68287 RepID=UPI0012DB17DC|nr:MULTISPECIES: hypothetical protein [Mesorhizobium]